MSDVRPQSNPEKPQQELRFTARDPVLDEAFALLEQDGERKSDYLPKNLFLFAMKRITVDLTDQYDGQSLNLSTFRQYRQSLDSISSRGKKRFKLAPWLKPLHSGGPDGPLNGIGMRILVEPANVEKILAPPLYGPSHHRSPLTAEQRAEDASAYNVLRQVRAGGYIPAAYKIESVVEDPTEAIERLRAVLEIGTYVSQMTIVPLYPASARKADIFREEKINRTYDRIDELLEEELTPPDIPDDISTVIDPKIERAS